MWKQAGSPRDGNNNPLLPANEEQIDMQVQSSTPIQKSEKSPARAAKSPRSTAKSKAKSSGTFLSKLVASSSLNVSSETSFSSIASPARTPVEENPTNLLRSLQTLAPRGMKYCLTLMPTDEETSFEKILKTKKQQTLPSTSGTSKKKAPSEYEWGHYH